MSDTVRLTEEFRGGLLDLTHYGYISIVDEKGKVIYSAGDPEAMVFYRSASKPVQALPVIAHHLDEKYGFTDDDLFFRVLGEHAHGAQHYVLSDGADLPVILHVAAHFTLGEHERRVLAAAVVVELRLWQTLTDALFVCFRRAWHGRLHDEVFRI